MSKRSPGWASGRWVSIPTWAERRDKYTLVRSLEAWESQHGRGQYYVQTAHQHNPALAPELPALGSVIAHEYASRRRPTDSLPPYVAFNPAFPI